MNFLLRVTIDFKFLEFASACRDLINRRPRAVDSIHRPCFDVHSGFSEFYKNNKASKMKMLTSIYSSHCAVRLDKL